MNTIISDIISFLPELFFGLLLTIRLWILSGIIGMTGGLLIGIVTCNRLRIPSVYIPLKIFVVIIRGIPLYIHVLIAYFVLPEWLGINLSAFSAAIIALSIACTVYIAEIVRAGINSIAQGQWDACYVLGYTLRQTVWYVIIPQMLCNIFPALINQFDSLIKSTAILSTIGVLEVTRIGMNIIARNM
ncbi:MAG TPA: amino acid ABC transporter permease, partial [Candidatus Bathyarchaeia archaeon]|nr:amino acid ABC transporter permease [Candidatus Bathyarchaeia archaeon]